MADAYEMLTADYDWMFDDELANGRAVNHPVTARLLQRISSSSAALDEASGTGVLPRLTGGIHGNAALQVYDLATASRGGARGPAR